MTILHKVSSFSNVCKVHYTNSTGKKKNAETDPFSLTFSNSFKAKTNKGTLMYACASWQNYWSHQSTRKTLFLLHLVGFGPLEQTKKGSPTNVPSYVPQTRAFFLLPGLYPPSRRMENCTKLLYTKSAKQQTLNVNPSFVCRAFWRRTFVKHNMGRGAKKAVTQDCNQ